MRLLFFAAITLLAPSTFANTKSDELCSQKSVEVSGQFGKHQAPLLKLWSETAGNFTQLKIQNSETFSKAQFVFKDEAGNILQNKDLKLAKNQSDIFDFQKMIKEAVIRPNSLTIKLWTAKGIFFCQEEMSVVEKDGQGGVLKQL